MRGVRTTRPSRLRAGTVRAFLLRATWTCRRRNPLRRNVSRCCHVATPPRARILADRERRQLRAIVEYLKPAHTHFVDLVEPLPPILPNHWELGLGDLGETTDLH